MNMRLCTSKVDQDNERKISHLIDLQKSGDSRIFRDDLTDELSFDAPTEGCEFVFHVATPVNFASEDPENDMIKPAIQGVLNVLKASARAKSVKRVVLTSSAATVSINTVEGTGLVMTEENWIDVEFLSTAKPPTCGYHASKTLAEKRAWEFAVENNIDLITIIPSLMTGNEFLIGALKGMQMLSGSISISHVDDVCRAHIFLAEKDEAVISAVL